MEKHRNYEVGQFSLSEEEIEKATKEGTLAELQEKIANANARVAAGENVEVVIKGTPAIFSLLEQRERIKETESEHDKMAPIPANELGREIAEELGGDDEEATK